MKELRSVKIFSGHPRYWSMRQWQPSFFILICLFSGIHTYAHLQPVFLKMQLTAAKDSFNLQEPFLFRLTFTNAWHKSNTILLPGDKRNGTKVIFLSFFKAENNSYKEIARESRVIAMPDAPETGSGNFFKYLHPGQSTTILLFVNDTANYNCHIEAHHQFAALNPGRYEVLAWYVPWNDTLAPYIFNKRLSFEKGQGRIQDTNKLTLPEEGLNSNYITLTITDTKQAQPGVISTTFCANDCKLCTAIEKENWTKVENIIDRQTYYSGKENGIVQDSSWRMPHKNIVWLSDGPDAILASLPSYTYRNFIFKNSKGYHYFSARWQLGIIYRGRLRARSLLRMLGLRTNITTSNVDYCKLVSFKAY